MALRTAQQYRDGLRDGRRVHYRGEGVADVVARPELRPAVDHSALCYSIADELPDLATRKAQAFHRRCLDEDLALAVAQTDVKGVRALGPSQADPDLYLRIVDSDADSITVRGARTHTSFSTDADEIVVLPTRAMGPADADYAVSFAVPVDTPGLDLCVSPYAAGERDGFSFPLSSTHELLESLTVFDDVRVPRERVFLEGRPELAGPVAIAFVDYHRFTAINDKLPLLDLVVGAAHLVAEANGIARAGHVRDKIATLVAWSETVRGLAELAALRAREGAVLEKYYAAAVPAEQRLRILNLIADLTVRDHGGYQAVPATHAEGSLEAEKMQIARSHDPAAAIDYVRGPAGIEPAGAR